MITTSSFSGSFPNYRFQTIQETQCAPVRARRRQSHERKRLSPASGNSHPVSTSPAARAVGPQVGQCRGNARRIHNGDRIQSQPPRLSRGDHCAFQEAAASRFIESRAKGRIAAQGKGRIVEVGADFLRLEWQYSLIKPKPEDVTKLSDALREAIKPLAPGFDGRCQGVHPRPCLR